MWGIYGLKWDDSLIEVGALKEEIMSLNPGSVVDVSGREKLKDKG